MRLLIASGIFHPDSGGPATYLYRLLPELAARGYEIRALTYGNAPTEGYPYDLKRIPYGGPPLIGSLVRWWRFARAYRIRAAWADVIYANTLGLPRPRIPHKPLVLKVVGDYAWERCVSRGWIPPTENIDAFQTRRYDPRVELYKASRARETQTADRVIVPSNYLRRMVIGWGAEATKVQVIYNALEVGAYSTGLTRAEARARLGWQIDGRYLLTAARLTLWKGVDYLIDALAQVPDVRLVIAGDGPMLGWLQVRAAERGVADRVQFQGKVPHEAMQLHMRAADYLALYSGYEGLSHTILEALTAGTPVIASARGGNPEIVQDGVNGLLVKHPDLDALVAAIRRAFEGDMPRKLAAGTGVGLERFDWSALVEQTARMLSETGEKGR